MNIETKYLGAVKIEKEDILQFSNGIPGFQQEKQFVLLGLPGNPLFQILQSVHTAGLAFIVADPYHFYPEYSFELDDSTVDALQIKAREDVMVLSIITLKEPFMNSTINLKAPLIINPTITSGRQYILNTDTYSMKASIAPKSNTLGKGE